MTPDRTRSRSRSRSNSAKPAFESKGAIRRPEISPTMGALAEFERTLITERTRAGMVSAKQRGAKVGRKPKLSPDQIDHAKS